MQAITRLVVLSSFIISGCTTHTPNQGSPSEASFETEKSILSYGMAKKHLINNVTTQADIIRLFGSPNNMTYSSDRRELWIYDQVFSESTTVIESSSGGGSVGLANSNVATAVGSRSSQTSFRQTGGVRTLTVVLEFDAKGILLSHSARSGGYR